jgi:hypothetical protein
MNEIIAKIDGGDLVFLALVALLTLGYMVHRECAVFEPADEVDEDEIADRIETAIGDAKRDLLGVLEEIRDSNQAILDDTDEAPGTSLHELTNSWGRPRGFRPAETMPPYEYVDLRKPE